ncbi:phospholipase A and acyltransferase 2-like isoform X1 [Haliotis rufescens]|uniref:phospholipase A and acyltransferase 2-like isoform X1 n=1 Tax=Haliotis rufescens TaxID=6454 RepID=UPI00201F284E|nr:phospholipase A and acyltransferase 2-like isoform X1 [Haliotis rufescens]XP_046367365.2 phospholipase A and acyltransferase 2-like isoform X1 [Haliotis rufescens]XP_046367366.2 phospholipase A and acyltransferase 2-like isoform X1 [Haliotis rufescens]
MSCEQINSHRDLEVGDLVEFKRGLYSHWAVYIGGGEVVHLAGEEDDGLANVGGRHVFTVSGTTFNKALVRIDLFDDVAGLDKVYRNNTKDKRWSPFSASEIVRRALSKLGRVGYNLIFSNCEHFVSWCRYDMERSDQVDSFKTGFLVGLAAVATTALVGFLGGRSKTKEEKEKEEESY